MYIHNIILLPFKNVVNKNVNVHSQKGEIYDKFFY